MLKTKIIRSDWWNLVSLNKNNAPEMQNELFWQFLAACSTRTLRLSLKKKNTPPPELPSRSEGGFPFREGPSRYCCLCFICSVFFGGVGNSFILFLLDNRIYRIDLSIPC
ncbi:hypothetical protein, partial [uncultured Oscillibacter sp.]|uniref:hypothetical protein n=1 Tax=uncultured Oscillibacter sp. TaxID=876091 RepID=UPI002603B22B